MEKSNNIELNAYILRLINGDTRDMCASIKDHLLEFKITRESHINRILSFNISEEERAVFINLMRFRELVYIEKSAALYKEALTEELELEFRMAKRLRK